MTVPLLWIGAAAVSAAVTWRATARLCVRAPLRARNHRGLELPSALGIAVVLGLVAGLGLIAAVRALTGVSSERMVDAGWVALVSLAGVAGFGLLGLWDDLSGGGHGWRQHLGAVRRGEPTGGAIKLLGGIVIALIVVAPLETGLWWIIVDAAVVALTANMLNLLDARPGRSLKVFGIGVVPMLVVGGPVAPVLMAGAGAAAAFLPFDLRERAMLGDTGAYALGAVMGIGIVVVGSGPARLIALGLLLILHVAAVRPGLSLLIERVAPLRRADRAGRVAG